MHELESIAQELAHKSKGLLAADESTKTIKKRFDSINVECTEETRRTYRELLFTTPEIEKYISGVIMYDETIRQKSSDGRPFADLLTQRGIMPGIKVDKGTVGLPGFPGEKITEGLDGLAERFKEYKSLGAKFAKWRAVITIGPGMPTRRCINSNAETLARYAAIAQEAGLVPIVEPEVLMDGGHDIERCEEATVAALKSVFSALFEHRVMLEGALLKPNMVLSGKLCPKQAGVDEVAERTVRTLRRTVPAALPGIVFLSGGQSPELATAHLNAMNAMAEHPWELSFSFSRALQEPTMTAWKGTAFNIPFAQKVFAHRAKCNSAARLGRYSSSMETAAA